MANKNSTLFNILTSLGLLLSTSALAVDVLKPEDEALLSENNEAKPTPSFEKAVQPVTATYGISNRQPRKIEWFDPNELPTVKQAKIKPEDPNIEELKKSINDCLDLRKSRLDLEVEMLEREKITDNAAYVSNTFEEINFCYEDIGREILETYYANDIIAFDEFDKKSKTFYVTGTDASFDSGFCGDTCSMSAIIDAQMVKFAEYRIYLNELLDKRPINE